MLNIFAGATALDFRGRKKFEQLEKMMKRIPRITRALQEGLAEFEAAGVRLFSLHVFPFFRYLSLARSHTHLLSLSFSLPLVALVRGGSEL